MKRGWCPDPFAPMQAADGWLVRLKPFLSRLRAEQAETIAELATRHGNGVIELTARGNLQIRGLARDMVETFRKSAAQAGLVSADPAAERIRNVQLEPLAAACAVSVARVLQEQLAADPRLAALPDKFCFSIATSRPAVAAIQAGDVDLRQERDLWRIGVNDGGNKPRFCEAADAAALAVELALDWLAGGRIRRPSYALPILPHRADDATHAVGWHERASSFGIGLAFGRMDAGLLDTLSNCARRFGDGGLHLTPWRVVLLSGVDEEGAVGIIRRLGSQAAAITSADDPLLTVSACVGSTGCASGSVDARADALALLAAGVRLPSLHVSGCAKGCAHPQVAPLTLIGRDGRYGLVRQGRASDTAQSDGHTVSDLGRLLTQGC